MGGVSSTKLFKHMTGSTIFKAIVCQSVADGSLGITLCSLKADVDSGSYYGPSGITGPAKALPLKPKCTDEKAKTMLWETSIAVTGPFFEGGETAAASATAAAAASAASATTETVAADYYNYT